MATVRITQYIRQHVTARINELYNKQKEAMLAKYDSGMAKAFIYECYGPALIAHLHGVEEEARRQNICTEWNQHVTRVVCKTQINRDSPEMHSVLFRIPRTPVRHVGYYEALELTVPFDHPFSAHMRKIRSELEKIELERTELLNGIVHGVLQECGSLRQVLEVWPSALEFMPGDAIAQHNKVVEKTTRRQISEVPVSVQAALLKAKLLGS